ncbi:hypothetical protein I4961_17590 [Pseudomonas aeruginosa]|nr:hypothetical protein [Pseudomonas aeruginosa]
MTLPFTRAAWRPLCSAAVLGAALWAAGASAAERRFDLPAQPLAASLSRLAQQRRSRCCSTSRSCGACALRR